MVRLSNHQFKGKRDARKKNEILYFYCFSEAESCTLELIMLILLWRGYITET